MAQPGAKRSMYPMLDDVLGQFFKIIYNFITKFFLKTIHSDILLIFISFNFNSRPRFDLKQLALLDEFFFISGAANNLRQLPDG